MAIDNKADRSMFEVSDGAKNSNDGVFVEKYLYQRDFTTYAHMRIFFLVSYVRVCIYIYICFIYGTIFCARARTLSIYFE